jgi:hypothetical protein
MKSILMIYEVNTQDCRAGFITVKTGMDLNPDFNTYYLHVTSNINDKFYKYHHGHVQIWDKQYYHNFRPDEIMAIVLKHARSLFGVCSVKGPKYGNS